MVERSNNQDKNMAETEGWAKSFAESGTTESERYLAQLAKRAFLSLWSFSNVYTDEGRKGCGNGKELCDLLVVFGDDVVLFSDKHCEFVPHPDINIAWGRWYRRAIEKSAKQLAGAESWLNRFPDRIFLDSGCNTPLPIKIPDASRRRVHLVAVTRGGAEPSAAYWGGGSSGSFMLNTALSSTEHSKSPFRIGWVLPNRRFVHVLDETSLDVVLSELDTASDFVAYLRKKQELLETPGTNFIVAGEEELVAYYLIGFDPPTREHNFPPVPKEGLVVVNEGMWVKLKNEAEYKAWETENEISYFWDELIEYQNNHIIHGSSSVIYRDSVSQDESIWQNERAMRMMAREGRVSRRVLGESVFHARNFDKPGKRYTRTIISESDNSRAYVIMSLRSPPDWDYSQYREYRQDQLLGYCLGCKLKFENVREIVGIAFDPISASIISVDFLMMNWGDAIFDNEMKDEIKGMLSEDNMWNPENVKFKEVYTTPFSVRESQLKAMGVEAADSSDKSSE